jgi:hypothetical protein
MVNDAMGSSDDDDGDYELNQPVAESMPARYPVHDCVEFEDAEILRVRIFPFLKSPICGMFCIPLSAALFVLFLLLPIKIKFSARDMRTIYCFCFFNDVFLIFLYPFFLFSFLWINLSPIFFLINRNRN